jgi:hypothetical protein
VVLEKVCYSHFCVVEVGQVEAVFFPGHFEPGNGFFNQGGRDSFVEELVDLHGQCGLGKVGVALLCRFLEHIKAGGLYSLRRVWLDTQLPGYLVGLSP